SERRDAFLGQLKFTGRPHLMSLRNVAHGAKDGTAVFIFLILEMHHPNPCAHGSHPTVSAP
ncbi:MAG: hypothetical protein RLZZ245_3837, partial [Verrucomicrobiota bacterium]